QSLKNCEGPVIAVGEWSKLNQVKYLPNLNKAYRKSGTAVHFTGEGLELLNSQFKAARKISGTAGVIIASGKGSGDESPLWIVSGTDREGLQQAVDVLVNTPDKISGLYSAAIKNGEVIRLPLIKNNK
ncbi:MAG: hypothetical protein K9L56_09535, partial [Clostridiales bacterium]|nr:hypothetical protein [Clostridiales bacterium]